MTDKIGGGAQARVKRPAGWYSEAAKRQRAAERFERRGEREAVRADRSRTRQLVEAQFAPIKASADRRLKASPAGPRPTPAGKRRKNDRRPPVQRLIEQRQEANRILWARRHPTAAAAERSLRKARAELLDNWSHKNAGTPETHEHASRCNQGALARLYENGTIDAEQLGAGVEIQQVAEKIGADVSVRTASLETRVDVTRLGDGTFYERLGQVRREVAYTRWRSLVDGPIGAVLDMIVEGVGFTIVAKRYRIHNRKAKRLLLEALNLWPRILGQVAQEIDPATLAAAQAAIL